MSFAFTSEGVIVTGKPNAKGVAPSETIPFVDMPKGADRAKSVQKAITADAAASTVALSYFLEAAATAPDVMAFAGYAVVKGADDKPTLTLKPEDEAIKKSRSAFNKAVREALAPIVKADLTEAYPKKGAQWVAEEWSAMLAQGSFAQCISVARKYVAYTGRMPCAYTDDNKPDIARGLSVYAMQQVCKQYSAAEVSNTFADKVRALAQEWAESTDRGDISDQAALFSVLNDFCNAAEAAYVEASQKTTNSMLGLNDQVSGLDAAIAAELSRIDEEETEQA